MYKAEGGGVMRKEGRVKKFLSKGVRVLEKDPCCIQEKSKS